MKRKKPIQPFRRKPLDLPSDVAQRFVRYMMAFHVEPNPLRRDEIACHTMRMLNEHAGYARPT
jgi:hypothetical protein